MSPFEFFAFKSFEQHPRAALKRPYFFIGSICTPTPSNFEILVNQEDVTDSRVRHPKSVTDILHVLC